MSDRMTLFFEPLDVLQFRDHRPSDLGFHTLAESRFPLPSVFLGCIRTALFRALNADFYARDEYFGIEEEWARAFLGGRRAPGDLCPRGPLVARRANDVTADTPAEKAIAPYLPPPLDLLALASGEAEQLEDRHRFAIQQFRDLGDDAVRLHARGGVFKALRGPIPWSAQQPDKRAIPKMLTLAGARRYRDASMRGERTVALGDDGCVEQSCLFEKETRVGIVRSPESMTAEDHMLYIKRPFRFTREHGFAVDVAAGNSDARQRIVSLDNAVVPLGGKAHLARLRVHEGALLPADLVPAVEVSPEPGDCALWFLTPMPVRAELEHWPEGMSAVTGRAVRLGGIDMSKGEPKPLTPALPAGTVIHARNTTVNRVLRELGGDTEGTLRHGMGLAVTWAR